MVDEGLITKAEAIARITPEQIEGVFYPIIDIAAVGSAKLKELKVATGHRRRPRRRRRQALLQRGRCGGTDDRRA